MCAHESNQVEAPPPPPEIGATFIKGNVSPGIVMRATLGVVRAPTYYLNMWDLSLTPPGMLSPWMFIDSSVTLKEGASVVVPSVLDNPGMKITVGDRVFGFVKVNCQLCKSASYFWLYVNYGSPQGAWYSEVPRGYLLDTSQIETGLDMCRWNIDKFMSKVPHGEIIQLS